MKSLRHRLRKKAKACYRNYNQRKGELANTTNLHKGISKPALGRRKLGNRVGSERFSLSVHKISALSTGMKFKETKSCHKQLYC